jgi:hypothetical protein
MSEPQVHRGMFFDLKVRSVASHAPVHSEVYRINLRPSRRSRDHKQVL